MFSQLQQEYFKGKFTLTQIKAAHQKVKSGADFPSYIRELIQLGVRTYDIYVSDGHAAYFGAGDYQALSEARYPALSINADPDPERFRAHLLLHQQGGSDYLTFCRHCAETGITKWTADLQAMTCTYYDDDGNEILAETIPLA